MTFTSNISTLAVQGNCARRLRLGYPWVFRSEFADADALKAIDAPQLVDFTDPHGQFVARGFVNPKSQLSGRVLTRKASEKLDQAFFERLIGAALAHRDRLYDKPYYRLIHAESDGMPGVIMDRYGDILVVQINTAGMALLWPAIEAALESLLKPRDIILRGDTPARALEGLPHEVKQFKTGFDRTVNEGRIIIEQGTARFAIDPVHGQKTGWFYDQRDNREFLARLVKGGRMLDAFCHTGAFGMTALAVGARAVTFLDSSGPALAMVAHNAALNDVADKVDFCEASAYDGLARLQKEGRSYDLVCLDPPAFVKSRKDLKLGMKGYEKLVRLGVPLVAPSGYFFFASCSSHVGMQELYALVSGAIARFGRPYQLIRQSGAGPDHPVHPMLAESEYLTALTFKFLD